MDFTKLLFIDGKKVYLNFHLEISYKASNEPNIQGTPKLINSADATSLLGINYQTLLLWVRKKKINALLNKGRLYFELSEIENIAQSRQVFIKKGA